MKQQVVVFIKKLDVDGKDFPLAKPEDIKLELSAIDSGGGFRDPILDFAFEIEAGELSREFAEGMNQITLHLQDPSDEGNTLEVTYEGTLNWIEEDRLEGMGRLKDENMSRDIMKFVMQSVRR